VDGFKIEVLKPSRASSRLAWWMSAASRLLSSRWLLVSWLGRA